MLVIDDRGAVMAKHKVPSTVVLGLLFCVVAVTGCTTGAADGDSGHTSSPMASSDASVADAASSTPSPSASPEGDRSGAIEDLGEREGARGPSTQLVDGSWQYTVTSGDNAGAICQRFNRDWWQLEYDNGELLGTYPELFVDDRITITDRASARGATVRGVGSTNNPACSSS